MFHRDAATDVTGDKVNGVGGEDDADGESDDGNTSDLSSSS